MANSTYTQIIKSLARDSGFYECGISPAERLINEAERLQEWIELKYHGEMQYIFNRYKSRIDPQELLPGAKSIISLMYSYCPPIHPSPRSKFLISKYAYGRDYHRVIRSILKKMVTQMKMKIGDFNYRLCVDSAPIMEKVWAMKSGLGWIGKNTCLINEEKGSFFFLSEILTDLELEYDISAIDKCADCQKCIDACPTGALIAPYLLDARHCISYLTIENKNEMPAEMAGSYRGWIFGCDICQDVCPFNKKGPTHNEPQFNPKPLIFSMTNNDWRQLTREEYDKLFSGSAVRRAGYDGLIRNIRFVD